MRFTGKSAIVTGGSEGIGFGIAAGLVREGARVVLVARREEKLAEAARALGGAASYVVGDAGSPAVAEAAVKAAVERHGGLDLLVNNAGLLLPGGIETQSMDEVEIMFGVNLRSAISFVRAALGVMRGRPGAAILNISSASGHIPSAGTGVYGALKAGLNHLTKVWAIELAPLGIRVNGLSPGPVDTPALAHVTSIIPDLPAKSAQSTLVRRIASVEEIVGPALCMLDERDGAFVNGTIWNVDGGFMME
ncbi:SDR family NAD(P)-dependent oxidoreductase [Polyangium aurulentum]|uniref:SDR family NAD(P)-dependent oxidoreductase n=1 Tax=Polyangium aurulentum TaxID=2567896 RepID=UPI0010AEA83F|nr:SDR family oxidoreductase [Polyangium aurulentum]UQA61256.1 SDR family oxidoreductase [Polyangium aurulentum]